MLAIKGKLIEIGILAISIGAGLLTFYLWSDIPQEQKKAQLNEIVSQLINFIIFVWIGKIVMNISLFISDPLAVLAYPSDSKAFYFAVALTTTVLVYKKFRKEYDMYQLFESFLPVFIVGSFVFAFIEMMLKNDPYAFGYVTLYSMLTVLYLFLKQRSDSVKSFVIMIVVWGIGMGTLYLLYPYVTIFYYTVHFEFLGLFFIISTGSLVHKLSNMNNTK